MTDALITLMNAPRIIQRSVALGILVVVVLTVVSVGASLLSVLTEKAAHIEEMRTELFRYEQIIARKPLAEPTKLVPSDQLFIAGGSVSVVQANLQERVTSTAAASRATIASMSGTPSVQINGATYVGLRADFEGSLQAVHQVIRQLETSQPPLIIRKAQIRTTNTYARGALTGPIQLSAQISVYGAASPELATAQAGGSP